MFLDVRVRALLAAACMALAALAIAPQALAGGGLTPGGWGLTPAGQEITVPIVTEGLAGPWGEVIAPDGKSVLVTSSGTAARFESVEQFDLQAMARSSIVAYDGGAGSSVFYGIAISRDGKKVWASGGGENVVHVLDVTPGGLVETGRIPAGSFPAGIALGNTPLGDRLYVANNLGGPPFTVGPYEDPPGHQVTVIDPATKAITTTIELGEPLDPYGVTFNRQGTKAYVTNWMGRSVAVIDTKAQQKIADIVLSPPTNPLQADHPSGIAANPVRDEVYTANASSDTVSVIDSKTDRLVATNRCRSRSEGPEGVDARRGRGKPER